MVINDGDTRPGKRTKSIGKPEENGDFTSKNP